MQVAYSGTDGNVPRYLCSVGHIMHHTGHTCGSLGGTRLDKAVGQAFLDAVTPAAVAATAGAIRELEDQHRARLAGQRLALERAQYEAERAARQFDACEPENRLVAPTLERKLEEALAGVEREQRTMAAIERTRPLPLTDAERESLGQIARNLPRLWNAKTTTQRDRKELLRSLISEVVVTIDREQHQADVEIFWEGGASTGLQIRTTPAARGHDRPDPPARGASPRPPDRRDPQPPRTTHRPRPAIHPSPRAGRPVPRQHPSRAATGPQQRAGHDPPCRRAARRLALHDPPLAARRAAPRRADNPGISLANPPHG
jgi:hypothetical protein